MADKVYNVLFLCTGNSARSIMAECILNRHGEGRFKAYSAGSHPKEEVHPRALALLRDQKYSVNGLRSKSWDEFAERSAPAFDFIFTVCGNAAKETCPVWPGKPTTAHWEIPDPAAVNGAESRKREAFQNAYNRLAYRINIFVNLPKSQLEQVGSHKLLNDDRVLAND